MALDFDKEMDFLLRNALRQDGSASVNADAEHLDPDALAAFAENAVSPKLRTEYVQHLADCDSCREILSNLILLNEDEEPVAVAETKETAAAPRLSWGERLAKLLSVPNLGYATAAVAVLLVGTVAFVSFYNQQQKNTASVQQEQFEPVQISEQRPAAVPPAPERREESAAQEPTPEELANANTAATPEEQPTPNASAGDNLPPSVRATRGENAANRPAAPADATLARSNQIPGNTAANANATISQQPAAPVAAASPTEFKAQEDAESVARAAEDKKAEEQNREREKESAVNDKVDSDDIISRPSRQTATADPRLVKRKLNPATRTVGGKTFRKIAGVWTDSALGSQNVITVSRGSDAFKNLDASVRSTAAGFGSEPVIIVSQGKAYQIR